MTPSASTLRNPASARDRPQAVLTAAEAERQLEEDLQLLVAGELLPEFRFQPIADLRRGRVAGYEALARLPVRAGLPPDLCLEAAGRWGLRIELERLLAEGALTAKESLRADTFLCVNVSPSFLVSPSWQRLLAAQKNLFRVVIEITEEQSIADYDTIRERMAEIKARGGMVAIDDAGAGYASLKHILELRPGFIKLDRNFVSHCDTDRAKSALIETMGVAASRMDAWIVAEGVETAGELAELVRLGVPLAQGYFLGRPVPEMTGLLPQATQELESRATQRDTENDLLLHAEASPVARSRTEGEALLRGQPAGSVVTIVDRWGRPAALLELHAVCGLRIVLDVMRCQISSNLRETLQRALTRAPECRFDPVVLIDSEGRLQGIARVDCLMTGVLQKPGSPP